MGLSQSISKLFDRIRGIEEKKVVMLGIDCAGKTTIHYKLKLGEDVNTIPTVGFNVETIQYKKVKFITWDVGGGGLLRRFFYHYYPDCNAVIYVVDSQDKDRISLVKDEVFRTLSHEQLPKDAILLVFANKQDLPGAMNVEKITEKLELNKITDRMWHVQATCAKTGEGLYEGLEWLSENLSPK